MGATIIIGTNMKAICTTPGKRCDCGQWLFPNSGRAGADLRVPLSGCFQGNHTEKLGIVWSLARLKVARECFTLTIDGATWEILLGLGLHHATFARQNPKVV